MTATALLALFNRASEKTSYEQLRTWVVAQAGKDEQRPYIGPACIAWESP